MKETQRGFIPLIVAIVLGLAAIGGGVTVMVAYQDAGRNETSITNASDAQTAAAAAITAVSSSEDAAEKPVASSEAIAVESKQKEAEVEYVPPVTVSGFGGSGGTVYGYAPVKVEQKQTQPSVPHPTTAQMAGVLLLCADARIAHICNQTFWDGYMTNTVFRSEVDALVIQFQHQNEQARLAAQLQQQQNCTAWMDAISPLLADMSPEASVNAQKSSMATCSGAGYDDTAYKLEETQEDVDELKKVACPLGSNDINCQLMQ